MILGMFYSGTRTANFMIVGGVAFFTLLSLNNGKVLLTSVLLLLFGLVLYFGPFYGENRLKKLPLEIFRMTPYTCLMGQ